MTSPLTPRLKAFIENETWTYAKTMPQWPHEYLVKDQVDQECFVEMVRHIRIHGYVGHFYKREITYFADDGYVYWTMGAPIEETTIINRCREEQSYESRLKNGNLP